ncbi:MAG: META domain-containing protein [bacterium]|nr:META domain-containing protein [bacterium]
MPRAWHGARRLEGRPRKHVQQPRAQDDPPTWPLGWASPERRGILRWLLTGLVLLLAACGSDQTPLADTEWRLVALGDAAVPAGMAGSDAGAEFATATDMTGWTGCNAYSASYRARGSELRLGDLEWTEAGCPSQALFRQEQRMQDSPATVERFEVSGDRLTLHSEGGQVLVFERVGE